MATKNRGAKNAQTRYQGASKSATPRKVRAANATTPALSEQDREYLNSSMGDARKRLGDAADTSESGIFEALERFGLSSDRVQKLRTSIDRMNANEAIEKAGEYLTEQIEAAREYSRENKGKVIGGTAGVLVGASLLAMALTRAAGEDKSVLGATTDKVKRRIAGARKASRKTSTRSTGARKTAASRGGSKTSGTTSRKAASTSRKSGTGTRSTSGTRKSASGTSTGSSRSTSSRKASSRKSPATKSATTRSTKARSASKGSSSRKGTGTRSRKSTS